MKVTREIIIKLHTQVTDAFLASNRPGGVEFKRFDDDNTLYLYFFATEISKSSKAIYEDTTEVSQAKKIVSRIINFLQGKRQTI